MTVKFSFVDDPFIPKYGSEKWPNFSWKPDSIMFPNDPCHLVFTLLCNSFHVVLEMVCVTHKIRQKCYHVSSEISTVASLLVAFSYTLSLSHSWITCSGGWAALWEAHITRNQSSCQWPLEWAWEPILQPLSKSSETSSLTDLSHNHPAKALPGSWPQKPVPW